MMTKILKWFIRKFNICKLLYNVTTIHWTNKIRMMTKILKWFIGKVNICKLLYNVTTIHWMDKNYFSFVLIYWSQLYIYYPNLSLILINREILSVHRKVILREWSIKFQGFKNYKKLSELFKLNDSKHSQLKLNIVSITL